MPFDDVNIRILPVVARLEVLPLLPGILAYTHMALEILRMGMITRTVSK